MLFNFASQPLAQNTAEVLSSVCQPQIPTLYALQCLPLVHPLLELGPLDL